MECLDVALRFGADAVYVGGTSFGLRAFADNFGGEDLREAVERCHALGRRLYVAVNALVREGELDALRRYLESLAQTGPDGIIFSDPAVLEAGRGLGLEMHLSTQASTMNHLACSFWHQQGIRRIVLARETTLDEIRQMRARIPSGLEIEVFVHGAMCVAHSGRCLMSSVLTGRSGNRGECAQPCRWEYELRERGSGGAWHPVLEDGRGTYVLNSRDLMMLDHLPELVDAGVDSLKIEGRMKSAYYVASVVHAYRRALDMCLDGRRESLEGLLAELEKSATRLFTHGFFFGDPGPAGQDVRRDIVPRRYTFVAKVLGPARDGYISVEQRNKFSLGETVEILSPELEGATFTLEEILDADGCQRPCAPHAQEHLLLRCPHALAGGELLRRLDEPPDNVDN